MRFARTELDKSIINNFDTKVRQAFHMEMRAPSFPVAMSEMPLLPHWKEMKSYPIEDIHFDALEEASNLFWKFHTDAKIFITPHLLLTEFPGSGDFGCPRERFLLPPDDDLHALAIYSDEQLDCISQYLLLPAFLGDTEARDAWLEQWWDITSTVKHHTKPFSLAKAMGLAAMAG